TDRVLDEGAAVSFQVVASDPDSGQTLVFSLGAGAPSGARIDPNTGLFTWTAAAPARYPVTVRVTDNGSPAASDSRTFAITVTNVAPVVNAGANATITQGTAVSRAGSFTDPGSGPWVATVDYGDGSGVRPLGLNPDKTFALNHVYTTAGSRTVTVRVRDSYGG